MVMDTEAYKRQVDEQLKPEQLNVRKPTCPDCDVELNPFPKGGSRSDKDPLTTSRGIAGIVPQHPAPKCESYKAYYRVYGKRKAVP